MTNKPEKTKFDQFKKKFASILNIFSRIKTTQDISEIVHEIADETKSILQADRCTIFLHDSGAKELYSWIAHGLGSKEIRFKSNKGLAGASFSKNEIINVKDAYKDTRFNAAIDKKTGYTTKTILCMPMRNHNNEMIGVFQVLNKNEGKFTGQDEEILNLLSLQTASVIENAMLYGELKKSFSSFINTLTETIDARDPMTAGHSKRVCDYALLLADVLQYDEKSKELVKYSALLHDLGKVGIKEHVLNKPGLLTPKEYKHVQKHASITKKILDNTYLQNELKDIPKVASSHHECVDGTGYPEGLKGRQIPEVSKIITVVDVFDALTSKRQYRASMKITDAAAIIKDGRGTKYAPKIVDLFFERPLFDIMEIMTEDARKTVTEKTRKIFQDVTLGEFITSMNNSEDNEVIDEFYEYYPPDFELDDEKD